MSTYSLSLPNLTDQPVLSNVQKAVVAQLEYTRVAEKVLLERWYADQLRMRREALQLRLPPRVIKRHRIVHPSIRVPQPA